MNTEFRVRRPVADDTEFLIKTWSREAYASQPWRDAPEGGGRKVSAFPARLFYDTYQREVIVPLFAKADARVVCPAQDASLIESFVVAKVFPEHRTTVVHFAYTRNAFRRLGLVKAALEDMGWSSDHEVVATMWSATLRKCTRQELIYNPFALYGVK